MPDSDEDSIPILHEARLLGFAPIARPREECWAALGEQVRARLQENAGETIEWLAYRYSDDRLYAMVFGTRGISFAEPVTGSEDAYELTGYRLTEHRRFTIEHRPLPETGSSFRSPSPGAQPIDLGLNEEARGILGNLPPAAQEALQAPFTLGPAIEKNSWYYSGTAGEIAPFVFYLANPRAATLVTGTKTTPPGHTDATAHWSLTCHQATVTGERLAL
ncbi:hypothetical protein ACIBF1_12870 [Spirillospora sp. NPDC050679]